MVGGWNWIRRQKAKKKAAKERRIAMALQYYFGIYVVTNRKHPKNLAAVLLIRPAIAGISISSEQCKKL